MPAPSHGMCKTREYKSWCHMKARCTNPSDHRWKWYGGRGIKVCGRWLNSFEMFYQDMGPAPIGHTLERISTDGNYELANCKWATRREQANNKRTNHLLAFNGRTMTIAQWENEKGWPGHLISTRLKRGWPIEEAVSRSPELWRIKKRRIQNGKTT